MKACEILEPSKTEMLEHYGILGMRWGKKKTKMEKMDKRIKKARRGFHPMTITYDGGIYPDTSPGLWSKKNKYKNTKKYNGTSNSLTGQIGSRVRQGIESGRNRAKKRRR